MLKTLVSDRDKIQTRERTGACDIKTHEILPTDIIYWFHANKEMEKIQKLTAVISLLELLNTLSTTKLASQIFLEQKVF